MMSACVIRLSSQVKSTLVRTLLNSSSVVSPPDIPKSIPVPSYARTGVLKSPRKPDIKTPQQVERMRASCQLAAFILRTVGDRLQVGMTTEDINTLVHSECIEAGAYPSPIRYKGFPKSVCTSVNNVVCHGIPGSLVLQDGDIINVDVTVFYNGYHGDTSETFLVGNVEQRDKTLVETARECRDVGISVCKHGAHFSDIGQIIYDTAVKQGFTVIPNFCGHGIGEYFHGPPDIVHVPSDSVGNNRMKAGMTFTIEPIICDGSPTIKILEDGWTVVTLDGSKSAQFEHTVLVTGSGCEVLTQIQGVKC